MANHSYERKQPVRSVTAQQAASEPTAYPEPEMRRWPHPVDGTPVSPQGPQADAVCYYIRCALSYQNQLLADIKALLEQLAAGTTVGSDEK